MVKVFLFENDISEFVQSVPPFIQSIGELGTIITNDIGSLEGKNDDSFWDNLSSNSPFFGYNDFSDYRITIEQDEKLVYSGSILQPTIDNQTRIANVTLQSALQQILDKKCIFVSDEETEPAAAALALCNRYGIPVDVNSFNVSSSVYNLNEVKISVNQPFPESSVIDVLQTIANVGAAKLYAINGIVSFDVFQSKTNDPVFDFSDKLDDPEGVTLLSHPVIQPQQKQPIQGYKIGNITSFAGERGTTDQQTFSIDGSFASPVRIHSLKSSVWIGETWLTYFNTPKSLISFDTFSEIGRYLSLDDTVSIEYKNMATQIIDIITMNNSNALFTNIGGLTR